MPPNSSAPLAANHVLSSVRRCCVSAVVVGMSLGAALPCAGETPIHVDADAAPGGDGSSWALAFNDLQDALETATPYNEIWIAEGTYRPDRGSGDRDATFTLPGGVAVLGGFVGNETQRVQRDPDQYASILSGDIGERGVLKDNSEHVVTANGTSQYALLDGLVITAGNARRFGAGLYLENGLIGVRDCTFVGNSAYGGGGVFVLESNSVFEGCTFVDNDARVRGAGIYCVENEARFVDCDFRNNFSVEGGSGMYLVGGQPQIVDCVFEENEAIQTGGAVANIVSRPVIARCTFRANRAHHGGAFHNDSGIWPMQDCWFVDNVASGSGGAISIQNGFLDVSNCVFARNEANRGGAIANIRGFPNFVNCSFVGNEAAEGGHIFVDGPGLPTIANSILWRSRQAAAPIEGPGLIDVMYSCVEGGFFGEGNVSGDPNFIDEDYRIGPGSSCIDAGINAMLPKRVVSDLDRNPRFTDDPATPDTGEGDTPVVDIGAYEFQPPSPTLRLTVPVPGRVGVRNVFEVKGATPGHEIVYVYGFVSEIVPIPQCPNLQILIRRPARLGLTRADENGVAVIAGDVPTQLADSAILFQAAEPRTCRVSNLVEFKFAP